MGIFSSLLKAVPGASLVDAGVSLFNGIGSTIQNKQNLDAQQRMAAQQFEYNKFLQNQQFENQIKLNQMSYDENERLRSTQYQTSKKDMLAAGINPNFREGSPAQSVTPASGSAAAATTTAPAVPEQNSPFSGFLDAFKILTEVRKTGLDSTFLERTLNDRVKQEEDRRVINDVAAQYSEQLTKQQLNSLININSKAVEEIKKIKQETTNLEEIKKQIQAYVDKLGAESGFTKKKKEILDKWFTDWFDVQMRDEHAVKGATVTNLKASANDANASAAEHRARTQTENDIRDDKVKSQHYVAALNKLDYDIRNANSDAEKRAAAEQFENSVMQSGVATSIMLESLKQARVNNDWATFEKIVNALTSVTEAVAMGAAAGVGVKTAAGAFKSLPKIGFR